MLEFFYPISKLKRNSPWNFYIFLVLFLLTRLIQINADIAVKSSNKH